MPFIMMAASLKSIGGIMHTFVYFLSADIRCSHENDVSWFECVKYSDYRR